MAINFVTGLPRAGKTLWTICAVKERAEREKRQVYTCNIPGITIPGWLEIEHPDLWLTVPHGSIILIDELQDFWQKGATGSKVPGPILELSKHGKRGIDFYIITQEPNLVHQTPRDLCAHHYYVVRAFGSHNCMVHKFERMQLHPEKQKKNSEKLPWRYNKEAFNWYKSADTHNVKREIPWKFYMIPVAAVLAGLAIWGAVTLGMGTIEKAKVGGKPSAIASPPAYGASSSSYSAKAGQTSSVTPEEYLASLTPRFEGLPHTAPRYDAATAPVVAPYPAACVKMGDRCSCFTQQATRLNTPDYICQEIVANGLFVDWQQPQTLQAQAGPPVASPALPSPPVAPMQGNPGSSPAVAIPDSLRVAAVEAGNAGDHAALGSMRIGKRLVNSF